MNKESEKRNLYDDVIRIVVLFMFVLPVGEWFVEGAESSRPGPVWCFVTFMLVVWALEDHTCL